MKLGPLNSAKLFKILVEIQEDMKEIKLQLASLTKDKKRKE